MKIDAKLLGTLLNTFRIAKATVNAASLSANRVFTLPDIAGTLALTTDSLFGQAVIVISTTATLTANRWHTCRGTGTDYTVTLPTPVGISGQWIGITIAERLIGNYYQTISIATAAGAILGMGSAPSMWKTETALLRSDGTNWILQTGSSIPMVCRMYLGTSQSIVAASTSYLIAFDTIDVGVYNRMADTTTNRMVCRRTGYYAIVGRVQFAGASGAGLAATVAGTAVATVVKNGATEIGIDFAPWLAGTYPSTVARNGIYFLTAGDYVSVTMSAPTTGHFAGLVRTYLELTEILTW